MDSRTGDLYMSRGEALGAGVPPEHVVELVGHHEAVQRVARATRAHTPKADRRAKRKAQKQSRRRNR